MKRVSMGFILCWIVPFLMVLTACGSSKPSHPAPVINLSNKHDNKKNRHHTRVVNQDSHTGSNQRQSRSQVQTIQKYNGKPGFYVVKNGDTLFSIARRSALDPQALAILNGIHPPYKIVKGQKIILSNANTNAKSRVNQTSQSNQGNGHLSQNQEEHLEIVGSKKIISKTSSTLSSGKTSQLAKTNQSAKTSQITKASSLVKASSPAPSSEKIPNNIHWRWPVQGRIIRNFEGTGKGKGIDIAGTLGRPIKAAAEGVVVYSGNSLKGYGNLIIIKHNEEFLSAYAHNRELKVKEGERVRIGQEIALMGQTDAEQVKVHFEIRYKGKPVNPLKFLPKA